MSTRGRPATASYDWKGPRLPPLGSVQQEVRSDSVARWSSPLEVEVAVDTGLTHAATSSQRLQTHIGRRPAHVVAKPADDDDHQGILAVAIPSSGSGVVRSKLRLPSPTTTTVVRGPHPRHVTFSAAAAIDQPHREAAAAAETLAPGHHKSFEDVRKVRQGPRPPMTNPKMHLTSDQRLNDHEEKFVDGSRFFDRLDERSREEDVDDDDDLRRWQSRRQRYVRGNGRWRRETDRLSTSLPVEYYHGPQQHQQQQQYYENYGYRRPADPISAREMAFADGMELEIPLRWPMPPQLPQTNGRGRLRESISADRLQERIHWAGTENSHWRRRPRILADMSATEGRYHVGSGHLNELGPASGSGLLSPSKDFSKARDQSSTSLDLGGFSETDHDDGDRLESFERRDPKASPTNRKVVSWRDQESSSVIGNRQPERVTPTVIEDDVAAHDTVQSGCAQNYLNGSLSRSIRTSVTQVDDIDQFALFEVSTSFLSWGESFMGTSWIDTIRQYKFVVLNRYEEVLFFGIEEDGSLSNCNIGPHKSSFKVRILDANGRDVIQFKRLYPFKPTARLAPRTKRKYRLEVSTSSGRVIGNVEKTFDSDSYYVLEDRAGECLFVVQRSCICTCPLFWDYEFKVLIPGTDTEVGDISWSYLTAHEEHFNGTEVSFPVELEATSKIMLLGVCFLLNFSRWQSSYLESVYNPRSRGNLKSNISSSLSTTGGQQRNRAK